MIEYNEAEGRVVLKLVCHRFSPDHGFCPHRKGVVETFATLAGQVYERLDKRLSLAAEHGLTKDEFVRKLTQGS